MDYICTWIYLDGPNESSEYPQVGKQSHLKAFQQIYWQCVAVFFALSIRFNPLRKHLLFSNQRLEEFPNLDGFDLKGFLTRQGVEVITLPLTWQTPEGYFGKWRNQFYIFDILKFIEAAYHDYGAFLILDSDCIINRPLDLLFRDIKRHGLTVLPMPYGETHDINGVTRQDLQRIYTQLDGEAPALPVYYGGEVLAAGTLVIRRINAMFPALWENMMQRFEQGEAKLNEEAHFLSYCYHKIGQFGGLEAFIKRIWTAPHYNNVTPADAHLPIWHLPSEKTGGIALLFNRLKHDVRILPVTDAQMPAELGKYLGVPRRTKWLNWKHFLKYTWTYQWLMRVYKS